MTSPIFYMGSRANVFKKEGMDAARLPSFLPMIEEIVSSDFIELQALVNPITSKLHREGPSTEPSGEEWTPSFRCNHIMFLLLK